MKTIAALAALTVVALGSAGCSSRTAPSSRPAFREAAAASGLGLHHFIGATGMYHMPEIVGPGAALFDYDNDGDLDVYLVQGWFTDPASKMSEAKFPPPAGWKPGNRLFRNDLIPGGALRFTDVTEASGTGHIAQGMGVAAGDIDSDGDLDLYVANYGPDVLYRNDGGGRFTDITKEAGIRETAWSTSVAFFDRDLDGDLDLFVTTYVNFSLKTRRPCRNPTGAPEYCGPQVYLNQPSLLYDNVGGGRFVDVTEKAGINKRPGPGLGVTTRDFNGDGWPDIYVANDGAANHLWINQKDGSFAEKGLELGAAYAESGKPRAGMGVTADDMDGDGRPDIVVTNLTNEGSTLYSHGGEAGFFDTSGRAGLDAPTAPYTGFGVGWFDYDNDGWLDLFMANGKVRNTRAVEGPYPYQQKNLLFHNEPGPPRLMRDVSKEAGPALELEEVSRAAVFGDIDNDGDIDVLVTNNNGPTRLLLNESAAGNHWLIVRVEDNPRNRFGYGACLELERDDAPAVTRCVQPDYSYLASNDPRVHFGLGRATQVKGLVVRWPGGGRERFAVPGVDRIVTVRRGEGTRLNG